jgi:hypothetical protein
VSLNKPLYKTTPVCATDLLGENIKKNREALLGASKQVGLEVTAEQKLVPRYQNAGKNVL